MANACSESFHCPIQSRLRFGLSTMPSVGSLFVLILLFNALDVVISLELVQTAADEFNPFIAMLMERFGRLPAFLGPKLFSLALLAIGVFSMRRPSLLAHRLLCFIAIAYGLLVSYLMSLLFIA